MYTSVFSVFYSSQMVDDLLILISALLKNTQVAVPGGGSSGDPATRRTSILWNKGGSTLTSRKTQFTSQASSGRVNAF